LILFTQNEDGSTGDMVDDKEIATKIGERLGLGEPSDPAGFAIWYVEAE
jgi:hypothetical protein